MLKKCADDAISKRIIFVADAAKFLEERHLKHI